jgi:hypothetical protein
MTMPKNFTNGDSGQVAPTVHLNGTDGKVLENQLTAAVAACNHAINVLMDCYPHGRDYYLQDDTAYVWARDAHSDRLKRLIAVQDELMAIERNVRRQNNFRGRGSK